MNNIQKIILGLACMGFGSAYAFTATQSSCAPYINNTGSLTINDAANIQACLQACPNLYGNGVDAATLKNIAQCKSNLSTLSFVSNVSMQNMQSPSYSSRNNTPATPPAPVQAQNTVAPQAAAQVSAPAPVAPATPMAQQLNTNNKSANQQIKWF